MTHHPPSKWASLWIAAPIIAVLVLCGGIAAALDGEEDKAPAAKVPAYTLTSRTDQHLVAEVTTMPAHEGLRSIFDSIQAVSRPDGGYFVSINCATGGTDTSDNRLANGKFAVGTLGAAQTGLEPGGDWFEVVADRTCPESVPSPSPSIVPGESLSLSPSSASPTTGAPSAAVPTRTPTNAPGGTRQEPTVAPTRRPTTTTTPPGNGGEGTYYANCAAVRAAGRAPLHRGQPGYRSGLDRDGDGVACDR